MSEFAGNRARRFAPWRFRCDWIRVAMTAAPILAAACTNTYVDYPEVTVVDPKSVQLPCLQSAVVKYEDLRMDRVQNTRNKEANYRKAMTVLTFGALAGSGAAALYSAHTDAVLALGLAGGGAYGAGNLFWPAERGRVLNRGNDALQCLTRTGAEVVASDVNFAASEQNITGLIEDLSVRPESS